MSSNLTGAGLAGDPGLVGEAGLVVETDRPAPHGRVGELLDRLHHGRIHTSGLRPVGTGFEPLDTVLDGGFLPGEVVLLGGLPGVGKTICALQWARNIAASGRPVSYACFEHDEATLLQRLLTMEMAFASADLDPSLRIQARTIMRDVTLGVLPLGRAAELSEPVRRALGATVGYSDRLQLLRTSSQRTTVSALVDETSGHLTPGSVLVVDYLQKLPVPQAGALEERVYRAVESLKDLAMAQRISVLALSAASAGGMGVDRLRLNHLRGSDAIGHESDVALIMNHKLTATSDRHLKFDLTQVDAARRRVVFSVEKNRRGEVGVNLEFEKDFSNFRFNPRGDFVSEALVDD